MGIDLTPVGRPLYQVPIIYITFSSNASAFSIIEPWTQASSVRPKQDEEDHFDNPDKKGILQVLLNLFGQTSIESNICYFKSPLCPNENELSTYVKPYLSMLTSLLPNENQTKSQSQCCDDTRFVVAPNYSCMIFSFLLIRLISNALQSFIPSAVFQNNMAGKIIYKLLYEYILL